MRLIRGPHRVIFSIVFLVASALTTLPLRADEINPRRGQSLSMLPDAVLWSGHEQESESSREVTDYQDRRWIAHTLVLSGIGCYLIYGYRVFWQDASSHSFIISDWNDPYQRDYAGYADKMSHAFGGYFLTRTITRLYRATGDEPVPAACKGFTISQALLLAGEIEDGFTSRYGFDPVDLVANVAGGLIGYAEEMVPRIDDVFDMRVSYWPSREYRLRNNFNNIAEDYSGQSYFLVIKPAALKRTWAASCLAMIELFVGFHSRGFMPGFDDTIEQPRPGYEPFTRKRETTIGISLNLRALMDRVLPVPGKTWTKATRNALDFFLEYYQHPLYLSTPISVQQESGWYRDL